MRGICVLRSDTEAKAYVELCKQAGQLPDHSGHDYKSLKVAERLLRNCIGNDESGEPIYEATWADDAHTAIVLKTLGERNIVRAVTPWRWQPRRSGDAGPTVLQLLR